MLRACFISMLFFGSLASSAAPTCKPILGGDVVAFTPRLQNELARVLSIRFPKSVVKFLGQRVIQQTVIYEFNLRHVSYGETIQVIPPGEWSPANQLAKELWTSGIMAQLHFVYDFRPQDKILLLREQELGAIKKVAAAIQQAMTHQIPITKLKLTDFQNKYDLWLASAIESLQKATEANQREQMIIGINEVYGWRFSRPFDPHLQDPLQATIRTIQERPNYFVKEIVLLKSRVGSRPLDLAEQNSADDIYFHLPENVAQWGADVKIAVIDFPKESVKIYPPELEINKNED